MELTQFLLLAELEDVNRKWCKIDPIMQKNSSCLRFLFLEMIPVHARTELYEFLPNRWKNNSITFYVLTAKSGRCWISGPFSGQRKSQYLAGAQ